MIENITESGESKCKQCDGYGTLVETNDIDHVVYEETCPRCNGRSGNERKTMTFTTWKFAGKQYLSAPASNGVHIVDEEGNNYGSWMDLERFRKRQSKSGEWSPLGKAMVQVYTL